MQNTYFDEIYFVRTAAGIPASAVAIRVDASAAGQTDPSLEASLVFGFNPFGWRIMGVIFATLMIPLMYLLGKETVRHMDWRFLSSVLVNI